MADSLDDFFAKKDKKRRDKSKNSAISAVALVKELEEGAKQAEYQVRKETKTSSALEILGLDSNDSDWKDFEEVERRDYSGLKVKEMSIQDQEEDNRRQFERTEQASDPVPWKSKEETVAAITSANVDPTLALEQQLLTQLAVKDESEPDSKKESNADAKDGEPEEVSIQKTEKDSEAQKPKPDEKSTGTPTDSTKDLGDTKKPETTSATPKKYVPPHERGETKTLEPVRLRNLIRPGSGTNVGAKIGNLQDENEYPSLG